MSLDASPTDTRAPSDTRDPRVLLAAERTLLAWIRTGLALMGFGFVIARFGVFLRQLALVAGQSSNTRSHAGLAGVALVGAGIAINIWASARHVRLVRDYVRTGRVDVRSRGPVTIGVMSGVAGTLLIAILLGSTWFVNE